MSRPGYIDKRGNARARARRREWLLIEFDPDLGPGRARCHLRLSVMCRRTVDADTLSVDRIEQGGSYRRGNIQPACKPCQDRQGGLTTLASMGELLDAYRCAREQWEIEFDLQCSMTYTPQLLKAELRKAERGGRNEVYDYVEANPPPVFREWLIEWHAARRDEAAGGAGAPASASAG
jgi:hypothetical protein